MNKIKKLINKIFKVFENDCDDSEETYASVNQTYVNIDQKMNDFNKLIVNISQENAKQKKVIEDIAKENEIQRDFVENIYYDIQEEIRQFENTKHFKVYNILDLLYKTIEEYDDLNKEYDLSTEEVIRKKDEIFKSVIVANRQIEQYFNILGYEIILPKIGEYFNEEIMTPLITEEKKYHNYVVKEVVQIGYWSIKDNTRVVMEKATVKLKRIGD